MEASVLNRMFKADITEKVTFEMRLEGERASHVFGEECSSPEREQPVQGP